MNGNVAASWNRVGSSGGKPQRVAAPATSNPTMVNTASCCKPGTPETKNARYAMHADTTARRSNGHTAATLCWIGTPAWR